VAVTTDISVPTESISISFMSSNAADSNIRGENLASSDVPC
jgi:hypothetical protein